MHSKQLLELVSHVTHPLLQGLHLKSLKSSKYPSGHISTQI